MQRKTFLKRGARMAAGEVLKVPVLAGRYTDHAGAVFPTLILAGYFRQVHDIPAFDADIYTSASLLVAFL